MTPDKRRKNAKCENRTPATTLMLDRNLGNQVDKKETLKVLAPPTSAAQFYLFIEELKVGHGGFWAYFRMSVGELEAL